MSASPPGAPEPSAILERARAAGIVLTKRSAEALAVHAGAVLGANAHLHLTAITEPVAFFERHLGEAFEGAALLPRNVAGTLLDLGSGNGYPGIPLALARPGLRPVLAESSAKKAAFLRAALGAAGLSAGRVLEARVARRDDLGDLPPLTVIATRAMGGWERIVPKLVPALTASGVVLIWAGSDAEVIMRRTAWSRLRVDKSRSLPGRDHTRVYALKVNA